MMPYPTWAQWGPVKGSPLAHVTRRYNWHKGRLRALRIAGTALLRGPSLRSFHKAVQEEEDWVDLEFIHWKKRNS